MVADHRNMDASVSAAYNRYVRFKALQQHSVSFYAFCINQALIHYSVFGQDPTSESLRYTRKYIDISPIDTIYFLELPFFENELPEASKLEVHQSAIWELARRMKEVGFQTPRYVDARIDTVKLPSLSGEPLSILFLRNFIPYADTSKFLSSDLLRWIYAAYDFNESGTFDLNSSTDFSSSESFTARHYEFHEMSVLRDLSALPVSWDTIGTHFRNRWFQLALESTDPKTQRTSSSISEVNIYGFEINLIFLLYLIAPTIAGLFVYEYHLICQIKNIDRKNQTEKANTHLFNYKQIFNTLPYNIYLTQMLIFFEQLIRVTGIGILMYGCLFRYSLVDYNNIPFNYFFEYHKRFEILDLVNLSSFTIAFTISNYNSFWNRKLIGLSDRNPFVKIFNCFGIIILPCLILVLTYVYSLDFAIYYYSDYSIVYFIVFITLLAMLYRAHIRHKIPTWQFSLVALSFTIWNWRSLIGTLFDL